ncbi:MAG: tRNA-binding protein [Acidimicrobiia bacterium]|nr:tRNA-binding protein [Acidimicrobiia bacterium]
MPTFEDFEALAIRTGTVRRAEPNSEARHPAFKLWIDFGELGELQSSARITDHYEANDLVGRQVVAVTGFPPMRVAGFRSDVLVLGAITDGGVILLTIDAEVPPGSVVA